jgi:hypothetical protein
MYPEQDGLGNSESKVPALLQIASVPEDDYAGLVLKHFTHGSGAQAPEFSDLLHRVMFFRRFV